MRAIGLISVTMVFFAANSILNRAAMAGAHSSATDFGTLRLIAGALTLWILCKILRREMGFVSGSRVVGVLSLLAYIYGFSWAYDDLDTGLGALILFGVVQMTMFAGAWLSREAMPATRWLGAALAFAGLVLLLWPNGDLPVSPKHGLLMVVAGVGWGIYSLNGASRGDALAATAANFILAAPLGFVLGWWFSGQGVMTDMDGTGVLLAVLSGALTSGVGYALWYGILPRIDKSVAAVVQLSVPVIALAGGVLLLDERLSLQFVLCAVLVFAGIAISMVSKRGMS